MSFMSVEVTRLCGPVSGPVELGYLTLVLGRTMVPRHDVEYRFAERTVMKQPGDQPWLKPEATGTFGKPPAHAPHETAKPLSPELLAQQLAKATEHEVLLPLPSPPGVKPKQLPFPSPIPEGVSLKPALAAAVKDAEQGPAQGAASPPVAPPSAEQGPGGEVQVPSLGPGGGIEPSVPDIALALPVPAPPLPHQKAASDTDTPSAGQPHPIADPGKVITGGWETPTGSQYFALNGDELRILVTDLMARLVEAMGGDLRFSVALTYPQVRATVTLQIDGVSPDAGVNDVAFTLQATAADTEETPADYHRDQTGQVKPYKRQVGKLGTRPILVD